MSETLKEYLDRIHINQGDDSPLVIECGGTEMNVSRRYLESEPMKEYLDMYIFDYEYPYVNIYGVETIKLCLLKGPKKNWRELKK